MNIEIHGTGRAAGALALAFVRAGHRITAIVGRNREHQDRLAGLVETSGGTPDLRLIAVTDAAIPTVASGLVTAPPVATVHTSGATSVDALADLARVGAPIGSFHPLQTLPDANTGADALPGSWIAITADDSLASELESLARSIGSHPFRLDDAAKPMYHAAATAASNYTNAALDLAERLFAEADVPFAASRALVDSTVGNAYEVGPAQARTGPVARGDHATIDIQKAAASSAGIVVGRAFDDMTSAALTLANDPESTDR